MSIPPVPAHGRRIGLALGGGGARGYAHIGVIEVLSEHGFDVVAVAGSSMGALVGGLYAAGQLEPYTAWVRSIGQREMLRLLDPKLRGPGAIGADKGVFEVNRGAQLTAMIQMWRLRQSRCDDQATLASIRRRQGR